MMLYVTYDQSGKLTGAYNQDLHPDHANSYIEATEEQYGNWPAYQANTDRSGLELIPISPIPPEIIKWILSIAVQQHLDEAARVRGYDNIYTACTYADEPAVPQFQQEGQKLRAWRSLVWKKCYDVMAAVEAGQRAVPTSEELISELPTLG